MKRIKKYRKGFNVSAIYWTDASEGDKIYEAVTFGVITVLTKKFVTIIGEVFIDGDKRNESSIPMCMVRKIITLADTAPSIRKVFNKK